MTTLTGTPLLEKRMERDDPSTTLDDKTRVPLLWIAGVCVSVVGLAIVSTFWISGQLHNIDARLTNIEQSTVNRWTSQDMEIWSLRLQLKNAGKIDVPDTSDIVRSRNSK